MRIVVDRALCMGTGNCVLISPEYFGQDEDGIVTLLNAHPPEEARADVGQAVFACPAMVISIDEDDGARPD